MYVILNTNLKKNYSKKFKKCYVMLPSSFVFNQDESKDIKKKSRSAP